MKKPILLFQGDSNTDWNRKRSEPFDLGTGYVLEVSKHLPNTTLLNRGVSGDRCVELLARWSSDCLDLAPDYLSIFVGINEIWHKYEWNKPMTVQEYEQNYRSLIEQVKQTLPNTKIILLSPFALPIGAYKPIWQLELEQEIQIVEALAKEYQTLYLSVSSIFQKAAQNYTFQELTFDGVHPTPLGHQILAKAVVDILQKEWNLS